VEPHCKESQFQGNGSTAIEKVFNSTHADPMNEVVEHPRLWIQASVTFNDVLVTQEQPCIHLLAMKTMWHNYLKWVTSHQPWSGYKHLKRTTVLSKHISKYLKHNITLTNHVLW